MTLLLLLLACTGSVEPVDSGDTDTDTDVEDTDHGDVVGVGVNPRDPTLAPEEHVRLRAEAVYEDGFAETVGAAWSSSDERVATVDSGGTVIAEAPGTTTITADVDGLTGSVRVTVTGDEVTLSSVRLSPGSLSMSVGGTAQVTASGTFSDGSTGNVTGSCAWSSTDLDVVEVDDGGKVRALAAGSAEVEAACGSLATASVPVTVEDEDFEWPSPDLRIEGFSATVLPSGDIEYTATVRNAGDGYASAFWAQVFLDLSGAPTDADTDDAYTWIPSLGAGETTPVTLDVLAPVPGTYRSWLAVDLLEEVAESDEANNVAGPETVTIAAPSGTPNLVISEFFGFGDEGGTLYSVTVENQGTAPTGAFWIDLWYQPDDIPEAGPDVIGDDFAQVANLDPGETHTWEPDTDSGPASTGDWYSCVLVDSMADVAEDDEDDNVDCVDVEAF